jgi:predicted transcriptional regulator
MAHQRAALDATTAGEVMTRPAVTIDGSADIREAARLMVARSVNRLPVTDSGRLVGMITRSDLLRPYMRSDDEIADLVKRALRAVEGIDVVSVNEGVVELSGQVPSKSVALTAIEIAQGLPGVVAVQADQLSWLDVPTPEMLPR